MFEHLENDAEKFRNAVIDTNNRMQTIVENMKSLEYKYLSQYKKILLYRFYVEQSKMNDLYRGVY